MEVIIHKKQSISNNYLITLILYNSKTIPFNGKTIKSEQFEIILIKYSII